MVNQHKAAFLDGANKPLRVDVRDSAKPGPGEVLLRVRAIAVNPVDWKIQDSGAFIRSWPTVLGEDLAGEVLEAGSEAAAAGFTPGRRVIVHSQFLGNGQLDQAGFQEVVVAPVSSVAPLPDAVSFEAGVVLPLAVATAAAGLFQSDQLALALPSASSQPPAAAHKALLVWGGSSSVGTATIQLAVAAGLDVVATASPRNFDLVKGLGARAVVDYNDAGAVAALVDELKKGGEFVGAYDAIGTEQSQKTIAEVVAQFGGGKITTVLPPAKDLPAGVTSTGVFAITIYQQHADIGKAIWQDFLPQALESGQFKPAPPAEVVGHGLDALQGAFDKQKAGVSAKKIVVTL